MKIIQEDLLRMQDLKYKEFHQKLIPTINQETVIGIRTPLLRKYAKTIANTPAADIFLKSLPHKYYEENNLHAFLIEQINDFDKTIKLIDEFLPFINNWATCDGMSPKILNKNTDKLLPVLNKWINYQSTYAIRFGILCFMRYYLDENFKKEYLQIISEIRSDEYYIKMMIAWYFATALAKQYDTAIEYIENHCLDTWTHNKAIQKACESLRLNAEQKEYLKKLKVKSK